MNDLDIFKLHEKIKNKEIKPSEIIKETIDKIKNSDLNAFITINEKAYEEALKLDDQEADNLFFGLPIAIKDNISTKGLRTTCASKMLENYIPIYDATVVEKIKSKNMIIIGKTNMDEFAFGSKSDSSYFGKVLNPRDKERVPGGSSGGAAAAVSADLVMLSLGSDTGGSIRQPASFNGIVGMKPTYGLVSRYGLTSFASSLDQIGPMTKSVKENAYLLDLIMGKDENDLTSCPKIDVLKYLDKDIKNMKIGIINYYQNNLNNDVLKNKFNQLVNFLIERGAIISYVDIPYLENAITLYQIIGMGEASSNLARFDGIRFGYQNKDVKNLDELYELSRGEAFGDEVKRRIMVGSFLLSGDNAKVYYDKALSIRAKMKEGFEEAFEKVDLIIAPTTSNIAPKFSDHYDTTLDDLLAMPSNISGVPSLSLPVFEINGMPLGLQITGKRFSEAKIYNLASYIEKNYQEETNV